jgi:hypothetical protein
MSWDRLGAALIWYRVRVYSSMASRPSCELPSRFQPNALQNGASARSSNGLLEVRTDVPPPEFIGHVSVNSEEFRGGKGSDINRAHWLYLSTKLPRRASGPSDGCHN